MKESINTISPSKNKELSKLNDFEALSRVAQTFLDTQDYSQLVQKVVDSVLHEVSLMGRDFQVAVLALKNEKQNTLERISISRTEEAQNIQGASETKFQEIKTPLDAEKNFCILAMRNNQHYLTHNFVDILTPPFSKKESKELQSAGNIKTSLVFPINLKNEPIGIIIFSSQQYIEALAEGEVTFITSLSNIIGIAVENSKLYLDLESEKQKIVEANKKLIALDKAKDEFLSVATHELRTPMTIIKSYLWMVSEGNAGPINEKQKDYLSKATRGTDRMLDLINDMLSISRVEQGRVEFKIQSINILDLVKEAISSFEIKATQKGISIKLSEECAPNTLVSGDETKIQEVLVNLLGNAVKFTKEGGIIIKVSKNVKNTVKVEIHDTGAGIEKTDQSRLFTKFGRLDSSYTTIAESGGTGLGLYIVKLYIQGMGGEVGVVSEGIMKGSTFYFTLPIAV